MQCVRRIMCVKEISRFRCIGVNTKAKHYSTNKMCPIFQIPMTTTLLNQCSNHNRTQCRTLLPNVTEENESVDPLTFEKVCEETLESLTDYFEELVESSQNLKSADIAYSDGVLTINLGGSYGTYVINRQSPNRQIWLSSPVSGPKRYDYFIDEKCWIYKHDGKSLHQLLQEELTKVVKNKVDFSKCTFSRI